VGSWGEAVAAYREATARDDVFLDAWNNLGIALAEQGAADEARAVWLQTLERHPSYCKGHNNLGWLAYRQASWDEAIAEFRTTLTYCPRNAQAHFALGNVYFTARRDPRRAQHHYEAVRELDPDFPDRPLIERRLRQLTF